MRKGIIRRKLSEDFKELPEIIESNNERTYILSEEAKVTFGEIAVDILFPKRQMSLDEVEEIMWKIENLKKVEELIKRIDRENLEEKLETVSQRLKNEGYSVSENFSEGTCKIRYAIGKEQFANFLLRIEDLPEIKRERIFSLSNNREKIKIIEIIKEEL
jgi:hypothetical protein